MNTEIDSTVKPLRFAFKKKKNVINKKRLRKVIIAIVRNTDRKLRNTNYKYGTKIAQGGIIKP